ncbi:MAG: hypothetical protein HDS36_06345 [Bacteroides sp.]|nr:hypothetical protein [Bacteroides sp.]
MSGLAPTISIPAIERIDFSSSEEAIRYAMLLCIASREAAALIPSGNLSSITRIRRSSRQWIEKAEQSLPGYTPGEALETIVAYDFIHRLAYNAAPIPDLIDRHVLRAFEAMLQGDSTINKFTLFRRITFGLRRKSPLYTGRPLKWQSHQLARWHKEIKNNLNHQGDINNPNNQSNKEDIEKISILLESDLFPFEGTNEAAFKQTLFSAHRHLLDQTKEILDQAKEKSQGNSRLSLLRSLEHLLFRSIPYLPEPEYLQYKTEIESAIKEEIVKNITQI